MIELAKIKKVSAEKVLKEKSKVVGGYVKLEGDALDKFTLNQILKKKTQIDELKSILKDLENTYDKLRDELKEQIESVENDKYDTVEYVEDGMRAFKYPRNSKAGKIDSEKMMELARQKKIIGKLYEKKLVLNEDKLVSLIEEGIITDAEFISVSIQAISPVIEVSYVDEKLVEVEEEQKMA